MTTEVLSVIAKDGSAGGTEPELSQEQLLKLYRTMVSSRALDERALMLQRQGRIGFYVPALGQEASHVGSAFALDENDWVFPSYRDPGIALLRGVSFYEMICQCYGNSADNTLGRQMPVHYSFRKANFVSISSPIGTQIVQAAGAGMAQKIRKDGGASMTYFGDGATSSNDFHCGMNFAAVYKAPVVFVCENNQWAISVPVEKQTKSESMAAKAVAYGMPGTTVDGNDVLAVYQASKEAVARAKRGEGPTLIETLTFRMGPHSSSDDPTRYRPKEVVEKWSGKDPIERFNLYLTKKGLWDEAKEKALHEELKQELQDAVKRAEELGPPGASTLFDDVYSDVPPHLVEQREYLIEMMKRGRGTGSELGEFPL